MKMHLESSNQNLISHYGIGVLSVNQKTYSTNILILPNQVVEDWFTGELDQLTVDHFAAVFSHNQAETPDILLLGTGSTHQFPNFKLMSDINARGTALEVMTTSAACRPYSVLVSEHRRVAAALIQIKE